MKPKLPRTLLWTDKTSMEEFLCEPINERLYYFYLDLKNIRCQFRPDNSALLLFNEIYYQLTKMEYEYDIDFKLDDYTQDIEANTGKEYSIVFVCEMFFAFLILRENNSNVAKLIQNIIFDRYYKTWNKSSNYTLVALIKENKKYMVDLKPHPCSVGSLESEGLQWDEITNDFNRSSVREVLNLWSSKEEKITVLHLIEDAYKRISRRPVKAENVMYYIRVGGYFSKLYSELGGKDRDAAYEKKVNEELRSSNKKKETPDFSSFVKDQNKVQVILETLHRFIDGKKKSQVSSLPIKAAIDAKQLLKPTWEVYRKEFPNCTNSRTTYERYTSYSFDVNTAFREKDFYFEMLEIFNAI